MMDWRVVANDIKLGDLNGRGMLIDGDIINLETTPNTCPADHIEIGLRLAGDVT